MKKNSLSSRQERGGSLTEGSQGPPEATFISLTYLRPVISYAACF